MDVKDEIVSFINETFLYGEDIQKFGDDASLLESGFIDSAGIIELVGFVESNFSINVDDDDLIHENFDSLKGLQKYINSKTRGWPMKAAEDFGQDILDIDCQEETDRIVSYLRSVVRRKFKKRGVVLGVSGGIDSSVVAALCLKAFGNEKVLALSMPEHETDSETGHYTQLLVDRFKMNILTEKIGGILDAVDCYGRRNSAIREVIPEFRDDWKCKIVLPNTHETGKLSFFSVVVMSPGGKTIHRRLPLDAYLKIVAASNFKQRVRKMLEYYHAERLNYAVVGTPNQLEYDQGFFVKNGDGAADVKPIAHLYKTQVYQLADYLGVPGEIIRRVPTTDTYSMPQTQDEFYFSLPYRKMDLCLYGMDNSVPPEVIGKAIGISKEQVLRVFKDIMQKRRASKYLHNGPEVISGPIIQ